jgi:hypothetical protein
LTKKGNYGIFMLVSVNEHNRTPKGIQEWIGNQEKPNSETSPWRNLYFASARTGRSLGMQFLIAKILRFAPNGAHSIITLPQNA